MLREHNKLHEMLAKGATAREIREALGFSRSTVRRERRRLAIIVLPGRPTGARSKKPTPMPEAQAPSVVASDFIKPPSLSRLMGTR